jgi:hypothetical protein
VAANNWYFVVELPGRARRGRRGRAPQPVEPGPGGQQELAAVGVGRSSPAPPGGPRSPGSTGPPPRLATSSRPRAGRLVVDGRPPRRPDGGRAGPRSSSATTTTSPCSCSPAAPPAPPRRPCSPTATCSRTSSSARPTPTASSPDDVAFGVLPFFHIFGLNVVLNLSLRTGARCCRRAVRPRVRARVHRQARRHGRQPGAPRCGRRGRAARDAAPTPSRRAHRHLGCRQARPAGPHAMPTASGAHRRGLRPHRGVAGGDLRHRHPAPEGSIGAPLPGVRCASSTPTGSTCSWATPARSGSGPQRVPGLLERPRGHRGALTARRLAPHRRRRRGRRRRLPLPRRPGQGPHHRVGFNVYPAEVEEVLVEHPGVDAAAVVGVQHPHSGEAVKAYVVARPGRPSRRTTSSPTARPAWPATSAPRRCVRRRAPAGRSTGKVLRRSCASSPG